MTVSLPGELLRALILKVVNEDSVIAEICTEPLAKSHNYKFNEIIACRRKKTMFGEDWEVKPKGNASIQELVQQEEEDALAKKPKPRSHIKKHKRVGARKDKKTAQANSSNCIKRSKKVKKNG